MREMGTGDFIVLALAGFLGGFTFLFATDFSLRNAAWCITGESHCVREWIGATSGWAAAVAAAMTIGFLAKQASEMRRQTTAVIRDLDPIVSFFDPRDHDMTNIFANRLQVVNVNARPVLIKQISVVEPLDLLSCEFEVVDDDAGRRQLLQQELETGRMYVPGIAERTDQRPTVVEIDAFFYKDSPQQPAEENPDFFVRGDVTLRVDIVIAGESHRPISLLVRRPDAKFVA